MTAFNKRFIPLLDQDSVKLDNDAALKARNAADSADVEIVKVDSSDNVVHVGAADKQRLAANPSGSVDLAVASVKFVKDEVAALGDVMELKGALDASTLGSQLDNAKKGDYYRVTVAGTLFGTNPIELAVGDALICYIDVVGTPDNGASFFKVDSTELDDQDALQVAITAAYNSSAASGNVSSSDSVQSAMEKVEKKADTALSDAAAAQADADAVIDDVSKLVTLTGMSVDSTNLGTFTGTTIADSASIKSALQSLETALEAIQTSFAAADISYVNTTSGLTATDVQAAIDEVEGRLGTAESTISSHTGTLSSHTSAISELELNQDDLVTLSGVAENSVNLGTFTGATIADNSTIKAALQALETELESIQQSFSAADISYSNTTSGLTATTVQAAIDEVEDRMDDAETELTSLDGRVDALEAAQERIKTFQQFTLAAGDITNGYVTLSNAPIANSIIFVLAGAPVQIQGVDFSVSGSQVTFIGDLASAGATPLIAGDVLVIHYEYLG